MQRKKYVPGAVGLGLLNRVILGPDGLGADITQARRNTLSTRIALPTALKCAHQHYPECGRTRSQSVHNRLNATALQIALQKMAFWGWISSDKSYSQRTKNAAGVTQDRNPVLSETTRPRYYLISR